ncbi:DUF4179 domain-containing protein [Cohnella panacarvi]|uniref:DUF4179 domain-containing protein n=1 Tax=Cohnella panacarvi TaxID=400776 RepID=UPI0004799660|nr:DUF4179 domain-containing protein [Cohnella panacarvi]
MNEQHGDQRMKSAIQQSTYELPSIVRDKLEAAYNQLPEPERNRRISKPALWICASIVILLAGTFALGFISPAMAQVLRQLPGIGTVFQTLGDTGVRNIVDVGFATSVGRTVEDKGVSVTLDQVVYDGTRLTVGLLHEQNLDIHFSPASSLRADGRFLNAGIGARFKNLPGGMTASLYTFSFEDQLPDEFDLDIHFQEVTAMRDGKPTLIDGNWWLEARVSKIKEGVKEKKFDPPLIRDFAGIRVAVTGVTLTPLTTEIAYELDVPDRYDRLSYDERREIPIGEVVTRNDLVFRLWDEKGLMLEQLGGDGHGNRHTSRFAPISLDNHELILRTAERVSKMKNQGNGSFVGIEKPVVRYYEFPNHYPYTVSQGEAGEITFRGISFEDDQTWVEYEVQGSEPYVQEHAWWVEDDKGQQYKFEHYDHTRLQDDAYVYKAKLPALPRESGLKIAVIEIKPLKRIDELELVIPLN